MQPRIEILIEKKLIGKRMRMSLSDNKTFEHIFNTWLPNSEYILDNRPHFEILGEKYKNGAPDSEEYIWIPITPVA